MDVKRNEIELFYALEAHPLSTEGIDSTLTLTRVRVDLLDSNSAPVIPNVMIVDLLFHADGSNLTSGIRTESIKRHSEGSSFSGRPWYTNFWSTVFPGDKQELSPDESLQTTISIAKNGKKPHLFQSASTTAEKDSGCQYSVFSSSYWSPNTYTGHPDYSFVRLRNIFLLPICLAAFIGLVAWVVGYVLGNFFMSLFACLGSRKTQGRGTKKGDVEDVQI
ncbi:hypothetical protein N7513_001967 [Penicillium frequentans]|nr:hypothetical protein N7513_001967 [Penicillium glabrum]